MLWLKRKEPDNFKRLRHVLLPHDYVNLYMTGRLCMEASDASGTGSSPPRLSDTEFTGFGTFERLCTLTIVYQAAL